MNFANAALQAYFATEPAVWGRTKNVIDVDCWGGVWGQAMRQFRPDAFIYGAGYCVEMDFEPYDSACPKDFWNFKESLGPIKLIFGKPPSQWISEMIIRSAEMLAFDGQIYLHLPLDFLACCQSYEGLDSPVHLKRVYICGLEAMFLFKKFSTLLRPAEIAFLS